MFSTKPAQAVALVRQLRQDAADLHGKLSAAQDALYAYRAGEKANPAGWAVLWEQEMKPDELRRFALALAKRSKAAAVFCGRDGAGYQYALSSEEVDLRAFSKGMNAALSGRGGGSAT